MKRPFSVTVDDLDYIAKLPSSWLALLNAAATGTSYAQLASDFAIPIGTVRSRLNRARNKIEAQREIAEAA